MKGESDGSRYYAAICTAFLDANVERIVEHYARPSRWSLRRVAWTVIIVVVIAWTCGTVAVHQCGQATAGLLSAAVRAIEMMLDVVVESDEVSWLCQSIACTVRRTMPQLREAGSALSLGARTRSVGGGGHLSGAVTAIDRQAAVAG